MKKFLKFENVTDLDLAQTLDCGQSFRWVEREDGGFDGVAFNRSVTVRLDGTDLYIENADESDRIILISEKGAGNVSAPVAIRSAMARRDLNYEILNYAIVEGRSIPARLAESMSREGTNRVVVASESEAFMGDVVRNLGIMLGKDYDIVMYAPSKVRTFETIEGSAYHNASLHICTSYFADYTASEVDRFVKSYRSLFRTEPSQFAFQGYDVTRYFVKAVARYGNAWTSRLGAEKASGLHTDFLFDTDENGNHFNTAVRRIIFRKDYTTTLED